MKNQREIYEALLVGETLIRKETGYDHKVKFNESGFIIWADAGTAAIETFDDYGFWQIHKEPKWYENIPDGGVLCWGDVCVVIIIRYEADKYPCKYQVKDAEDETITRWTAHAVPLTEQEIQMFMDNAPEES